MTASRYAVIVDRVGKFGLDSDVRRFSSIEEAKAFQIKSLKTGVYDAQLYEYVDHDHSDCEGNHHWQSAQSKWQCVKCGEWYGGKD